MVRQDSIALVYLFVVLGWMPAAGIFSFLRLKAGKPMPPKTRFYRNMIAVQVVLLVYSLAVARHNEMSLLSNPPALWIWLISALYVAFIGLRLQAVWKKIPAERKNRARRLLPEIPGHLRYWVPISFLAGIGEEIGVRDCNMRAGVWFCAHDAGMARRARNRSHRAGHAWNRLRDCRLVSCDRHP